MPTPSHERLPGSTKDARLELLRGPKSPFRAKRARAGSFLCRRGEPPDGLTYVVSGRVMLSRSTHDGVRIACSSRRGGSLLGIESFLEAGATRDCEIVEDARLLIAPVADVRPWLASRGAAALLLRLFAEELSRCATEQALASGSAPRRVARYLLERDASWQLDGWRGATLTETACLLAIRPETLSRAIARLEAEGLIDDGRVLRVVDRPGLAAIAGET